VVFAHTEDMQAGLIGQLGGGDNLLETLLGCLRAARIGAQVAEGVNTEFKDNYSFAG
jgi:hypothetical protein